MKKIFFVALGATLLAASCQKTEIINHVGDALTFSTGMGKLTKADDAGDMTTLKSQNFSVWAYYAADDQHTNGDDTHAVYGGIDNVVVSFGDNDKWGTTEQYYWPGVGKELIFFAVSCINCRVSSAGPIRKSISYPEFGSYRSTVKETLAFFKSSIAKIALSGVR